MGWASLNGVRFRTSPHEIRFDFKMKVKDSKSLGGKVIQILGTTLGDITVSGSFGRGDRAKGDTAGWEEQDRFREQIKTWTRATEAQRYNQPLRFLFPERNWDFQVFIKAYSSPGGGPAVTQSNTEINPKWQLTLFVVDDASREVVRGIRDLYIRRLMEGIGWKQTEYNGPSAAEVEQLLAGKTLHEYLGEKAQGAFDQGSLPVGGQEP